jgi:hypothetical protein
MSEPRRYVLTFRASPGADGLRAVKALLRAAWRQHRLKCIAVTCDPCDQNAKPAGADAGRIPRRPDP